MTNKELSTILKMFKKNYAHHTTWFEEYNYVIEDGGIEIYPALSNDVFYATDVPQILAAMCAGSWYMSYDKKDGIYARVR